MRPSAQETKRGLACTLATAATTNRLTAASYDDRGNMTSYNGQTYTWDAMNRMTKLTGGGNDYRYLYTADDERIAIRRIDGGVTTANWTLRGLDQQVIRVYQVVVDPTAVFADGLEHGTICAWSAVVGGSGPVGTCSKDGLQWVRDDIYRGAKLLGSESPQTSAPDSGKDPRP